MEKAGNLLQSILNRASKQQTDTARKEKSSSVEQVSSQRVPPVAAVPAVPVAKGAPVVSVPSAFPQETKSRKFGNGNRYRDDRVPYRPKSTPTAIESVLKNVLKSKGLDTEVERYRFILHWKEIVGEDLEKCTKPECLRRDVLVVRVASSVWAQELSFRKFEILDRLQPFLAPGQSVTDLAFYVVGK